MSVGAPNDGREALYNAWFAGLRSCRFQLLQNGNVFLQIPTFAPHLAILDARQLADVNGRDLGDLRERLTYRFTPIAKCCTQRLRIGDWLASLHDFA